MNVLLVPSTRSAGSHAGMKQVDHVKAERNVLAEVHNPYVVKLFYSFQVGCCGTASSA